MFCPCGSLFIKLLSNVNISVQFVSCIVGEDHFHSSSKVKTRGTFFVNNFLHLKTKVCKLFWKNVTYSFLLLNTENTVG